MVVGTVAKPCLLEFLTINFLALISVSSGNNSEANSMLASVYSCAQYTRVLFGKLAILNIELYPLEANTIG